MATTQKSDLISPEVLADAIQGELAGMSFMFGTGAIQTVRGLKLTDAQKEGGEKVKIPYFNHIGEFEDVTTEGGALTPSKITMTTEESPVIHTGKAFSSTDIARIAAAFADPEGEAARQMATGFRRRIEREAIVKARVAAVVGGMGVETDAATITHDALVDLIGTFGDEEDGVVAIAMHSKVRKDVRKIKDTTGQPIFVDPRDGSVPRLMGRPVIVSDMCAQVFPSITAAGTTPPAVTITGEVIGSKPISLRIEITTLGARGVAAFRYSLDGGTTFSDPALTAAAVALGKSGLTANFAVGNYAVDNVYTGVPRFETLALKAGSIIAWIQDETEVMYDTDILTNTRVLAVHAYAAVHAYSRLRGSTRPGVARLRTQ
jgi:hypothetical protein